MEAFPSNSPFKDLKISDQTSLKETEIGPRSTCSGCNKSVKYFCYRCVKMVEALEGVGKIPQVNLPINLKMYFNFII